MSTNLPSEYLKLNYIESTGTQYIDTLYKPNGRTEIDVSWYWNTDGTTQSRAMFGVDASWHTYSFSQYCDRLFCYGNLVYRADGAATTGNDYFYYYPSGLHHFVFKNQHLNLNETIQFNVAAQTFQSSYNLWLFAHNRAGHKESTGGMDRIKFYYAKIWERDAVSDDSVLIRDYVPCLRLADGKPGLYDLVNDMFYVNQNPGNDFVYNLECYKTCVDNNTNNTYTNYKTIVIDNNGVESINYKTNITKGEN